jgi:hypothetical protein
MRKFFTSNTIKTRTNIQRGVLTEIHGRVQLLRDERSNRLSRVSTTETQYDTKD